MKVDGGERIRILAHLMASQKASRAMTGGVLHYAAIHPEVQVQLYGVGTPCRSLSEFRDWKPDGIITGANDAATLHLIESVGCRVAVFVNAEPPCNTTLRCGCVSCDNAAIAASAADLFHRRHLKHFAYVNTRELDQWSVERGKTLQKCADNFNCTYSEFASPEVRKISQRHELAILADWIAALKKPCGIFAANDSRAKDVIDACKSASVSIPEQVVVLGVDDEDFICTQLNPTLSSILPDFARGGYLAAETVVDLVSKEFSRLPHRKFGVQGIVERISTSDLNGSSRMVSKAVEFMQLYAGNRPISASDVAKAAGASLRLLQMNYKAVTGTTISNTLQSIRLKKVCELLEQTATPIGNIGELCGFNNEAYLKKLFRARFGCTMRNWRKRSV